MGLYRAATFITILVILCAPSLAYAQDGDDPPAIPAFGDLPAIVAPLSLTMPWQCGDCSPTSASLQPIQEEFNWLDPLSGFKWLGAQLWNRVALPVICWLLAALQAILNAASWAINNVFVAALNFIFRFFLFLILVVRSTFLHAWAFIGWVRLLLWDVWGWLVQFPEYVWAWLRLAREMLTLLGLFLVELGRMILSAAQALLYMLSMLINLLGALVLGVFQAETPEQLTGIENNIFYQMFVGTLQGIADSKLWWGWYGFIALIYARFALWIVDESGRLNQ